MAEYKMSQCDSHIRVIANRKPKNGQLKEFVDNRGTNVFQKCDNGKIDLTCGKNIQRKAWAVEASLLPGFNPTINNPQAVPFKKGFGFSSGNYVDEYDASGRKRINESQNLVHRHLLFSEDHDFKYGKCGGERTNEKSSNNIGYGTNTANIFSGPGVLYDESNLGRFQKITQISDDSEDDMLVDIINSDTWDAYQTYNVFGRNCQMWASEVVDRLEHEVLKGM